MTKSASEGAPKLETPEKPKSVSEETPRDEEASLETPEEPDVRVETRVTSYEELVATLPDAPEDAILPEHPEWEPFHFGVKPVAPVAPPSATPDVVELYRHVADNAVNAHAPVWLPRQSNSS